MLSFIVSRTRDTSRGARDVFIRVNKPKRGEAVSGEDEEELDGEDVEDVVEFEDELVSDIASLLAEGGAK
jgi:hypothetical protein